MTSIEHNLKDFDVRQIKSVSFDNEKGKAYIQRFDDSMLVALGYGIHSSRHKIKIELLIITEDKKTR